MAKKRSATGGVLEGEFVVSEFETALKAIGPAKIAELDLLFASVAVSGVAMVELAHAWKSLRKGMAPTMTFSTFDEPKKHLIASAKRYVGIAAKAKAKKTARKK